MSLRRKTYDGDIFGGSVNAPERRNSFNNEGKIGRDAPAKRTNKQAKFVDPEENIFAEDGEKDRYLITYADLITLLLGLFIIMYAISNIDSIKYKNVASAMGSFFGNSNNISQIVGDKQVVEKPANMLSDELSKLIVDNNYDASVRLEESERGITIHILGDILFAPGKAEIGIDSKNILSKIANVLKKIPNDLRIEGHTDDTPISTFRYPSNWHLSVDRALSTAYFFIKDQDIHPDRVSVVGYSEYKPIASNKEAQTRALNRRVDIVILK